MADPRFHKKTDPKSLKELAELSGAELVDSDGEKQISDVSSLADAGAEHISFLDNVKYKELFEKTKAGACIVAPKFKEFAPEGCQLLVSKTPYKVYALIAQAFYPEAYPPAKISDHAHIDSTAKIGKGSVVQCGAFVGANAEIGENCCIEANAVIGEGVQMGSGCRIGANASVSHAVIGNDTRLYPGARVGQDGFGFAIDPAGHVKVPQLGRVIIGDHVEIGANTCIDRGAGPDTVIGDSVWMDNFVQIGHNVQIGKGCVIVAQAGIAGSTVLEDYVVVAAQVGIAGHLRIGQGTNIGAQSGVMHDMPAGSRVVGAPAVPVKQFMRQIATLKKLTNPSKND